MDYKALGKNIKKLRLMAGLKQSELAEKCDCSDSISGRSSAMTAYRVLT